MGKFLSVLLGVAVFVSLVGLAWYLAFMSITSSSSSGIGEAIGVMTQTLISCDSCGVLQATANFAPSYIVTKHIGFVLLFFPSRGIPKFYPYFTFMLTFIAAFLGLKVEFV